MLEFLKKIIETDFLPHGACYLRQPGVLWLNLVSERQDLEFIGQEA